MMMRCTRTLILFLALLTGCMATPAMPSVRTSEMIAPETLAAATTPLLSPTTTAAAAVTATTTSVLTPSATPTAAPTATAIARPTAPPTALPQAPMVTVMTNANLRAGPGTAYPVIGGVRVGQTLLVTGQAQGWWRTDQGWGYDGLVTPNTVAQAVPEVKDIPLPPPTATPQPTATSTPRPQADLVVLGPDTVYPVRAKVVRGWGYEFTDLSEQYDIVLYRDVFGYVQEQIAQDDARRYRKTPTPIGVLRITLIDAQPHPDPACFGWGWAPDRDTFIDPLGMLKGPCYVEHTLSPFANGAGVVLWQGWGYTSGGTVAVGVYGPTLADWSTTYFAEFLHSRYQLPNERPDFTQPIYAPLGQAHKENGYWVWHDPFVRIVPVGE